MKILSVIWFTTMGSLIPIGIVIGEDEHTGKKKAYIGTGFGNDERADAQHIAATGAKFSQAIATRIATSLDDSEV